MNIKSSAHEAFRKKQYRLVDDKMEELGLGQVCVLCHVGIPGGTHVATAHHEILPQSSLHGTGSWKVLFALENIAPTCEFHNTQLSLPIIWMKANVETRLADAEQYRVAPFNRFWRDGEFPPVATCYISYPVGNDYFKSNELPESLARLYRLNNPDFHTSRFCDFCEKSIPCRLLTTAGAKKEENPSLIVLLVPGMTED